MRHSHWLLGICLLAMPFSVAAAQAADQAAPIYKTPVAYTWTGFYAGVNAGYGSATASTTGGGATGSETLKGPIGGVQAGYNWQTGNLVLGIEGDIQASGQRNTFTVGAISVTDEITYFGTVRGRLGLAMNRWLVYGTGGWGYGEFKSSAVVGGLTVSASDSHSVWTIGGGVEALLWDRWSVKLEYLYLDTGTISSTVGGVAFSSRVKDNIVRAGLNYHF